MSEPDNIPLLEVRDLTKRFPGVLALDQVEMQLGRGEVLAVIGENGAGKSTLMKILAGVQLADSGQILIDGVPVQVANVQQALGLGISLIHQELTFLITSRWEPISFLVASLSAGDLSTNR